MINRPNKINRYYIPWNSIYENGINYPYERFIELLTQAGATNIKKRYHFNWKKMPKVITFLFPNGDVRDLEDDLNKALNQIWILILPKDW